MFHCTGNMQLHHGHGGTGPGREQPLTIRHQTDQVWTQFTTEEEEEETDKDCTVHDQCLTIVILHSLPGPSLFNPDNRKMENWQVAQRDSISNWEGKLWSSEVPKVLLLFKGLRILCHVQMHINQKGFTFYTISLFWESINNRLCL